MDEDRLVELARGLSTATVHEAAGKIGALPSFIKPLDPRVSLYGRAFPVSVPSGDNLFLHHAIYAAAPGDVLVAECSGARDFGYWGEVMAVAAEAVGLAGLVIEGGIRDSLQMQEMGFPVFAGNVCIRGTGKDPTRGGAIGQTIMLGDVTVRRGDIVIGDADGVMIVPQAKAEAVFADSRNRDTSEVEIFARLRAGETSLDIYNLPSLKGDR